MFTIPNTPLKNKFSRTLLITAKWCFYAILSIMILIYILWVISEFGTNDYGSFYDSGRAWLSGMDPYAGSYPNVFRPLLNGIPIPSPNLNPPISVYFFSLFSLLEIHVGYRIWQGISFVLFLVGLIELRRTFRFVSHPHIWLWIFSLAGFWRTIELGQIYVLLFLFVVFMYTGFANSKEIQTGIFLGLLIALKPNFVYILLLLLVAKFYKVVFWTILSGFITILIPFSVNGIGIFSSWINASLSFSGFINPGNSTLIGFFSGLGLSWVGWVISGIILSIIVVFIYRKKPHFLDILWLGLISSILFAPIGWPGYMLVLIPGILIRRWNVTEWVVFFTLCLPIRSFHALMNVIPDNFDTWARWYAYSFIAIFIIAISKIWQGKPFFVGSAEL